MQTFEWQNTHFEIASFVKGTSLNPIRKIESHRTYREIQHKIENKIQHKTQNKIETKIEKIRHSVFAKQIGLETSFTIGGMTRTAH